MHTNSSRTYHVRAVGLYCVAQKLDGGRTLKGNSFEAIPLSFDCIDSTTRVGAAESNVLHYIRTV